MREEIKQAAETVASHPKSLASAGVIGANWFGAWWLEWGSPIVDAIGSVLAIILAIVLIRYHWLNGKKVRQEINNDN